MADLSCIVGFDWDSGNLTKNVESHLVTRTEAEQVFFNELLLFFPDPAHSMAETRNHALGKTDSGRRLHITFTLRQSGTLIRVISARDMSAKERQVYGKST